VASSGSGSLCSATPSVTVIRAAGDDYSFIDARSGYAAAPPAVIDLAGDHYGVLREPGVAELARAIRHAKEL